ncbi:unnamed protein product [Paramecium sonneborni]|uniref:Uncharacterized protein n=1 Tax=Paramecium sonneborni TaxID=65129 RepID=A0A8S1LI26_9CILI|nr:unnamed protein product [Paramecium sonneborni]
MLYQTMMQRAEIQFDSCKQSIKNSIDENSIGIKYKKQLEKKKFFILEKLDYYLQKLINDDGNVITLYCDFNFDEKLTLFLKAGDIKQEFINSSSPSYFCGKKNQLDLHQQLLVIRENILKEFEKYNSFLILNEKKPQNQDIWSQADYFLKNNTQQAADKCKEEAEKCRKNMVKQLIKNDDLSQYLEFQFYLEIYHNYFDDLSVQKRNEIFQQFKQLMVILKENGSAFQMNQYIQNNMLFYKNKRFVINKPMDPSLNIPIFLWEEIQSYQLQGLILCLMVDLDKTSLNFKVIRDIVRELQRRQQKRIV